MCSSINSIKKEIGVNQNRSRDDTDRINTQNLNVIRHSNVMLKLYPIRSRKTKDMKTVDINAIKIKILEITTTMYKIESIFYAFPNLSIKK